MATLEELATKYEDALANVNRSILGIYDTITGIEDDIATIEQLVMPGLTSDMNTALAAKAAAFDSYYGSGHTVVTSGAYGVTNLTEWGIVSGGNVVLSYYSGNNSPIQLEDFHTYETPITMDYKTLIDEQQVLVHLDSSFNYNLLSMPTSGDDLRFYTDTGQECEYWIEQWNMGGDSYIWVKIPKKDIDSFVMRYGNDTMTAGTSGNNTFDYFWDLTQGELPDGWEERGDTTTTIVYTDEYTSVEIGGIYYQLPDIQIQDGYQVGCRCEFEIYTTGNANAAYSAMTPGIVSDGYGLDTGNLTHPSFLWQARHRATPTRFYLYASTGATASWDAYAGSYNTTIVDDTWYTMELGIDTNGYAKSYWDHVLRSLNPGTDTYYKPMNYISLGSYYTRPATYQDVVNTHYKYVWVRKFVDYTQEPTSTLGTTVSANSWLTNTIILTHGDETSTVEVLNTSNPYHMKELNFDGVDFTKVTMTAKVVSGSDAYMTLSYRTTDTVWHSGGWSNIPLSGGYAEIEWDMSTDSDWTTGTIDRVAIVYKEFEVGDIIEFTEVKITDDLNENAEFYADSFAAAYKHLTNPLGKSGTYGLKPMKAALNVGKLIQERNKVAITNASEGYRGVAG